jgi:AcrR family transcriptional regulator
MDSKVGVKRQLILNTAKQIVIDNGFISFTLDAVAKKAGVSKGGLLYHFPNKVSLIKELAQYIYNEFCLNFYKYAENDSDEKGKWCRALIKASKLDLEQHGELNVGILANSFLEPEIAESISESYTAILKKLEDDGIDSGTATIIRLALDGLYYSQSLQVAPLEKERINEVIHQLLKMTKEEE